MDGNFFFVIGIILVSAALLLAFLGIRGSESFPPSRGVMVGVIGLFAAVVATTMAFAIVKSVDEQDQREEKQASEEQQAQAETGQPATSGAPGINLAVDSPADGSLVFQPSRGPVPLDDHTRWWAYVPGASWRTPEGPGSDTYQRIVRCLLRQLRVCAPFHRRERDRDDDFTFL